MYDLVFLNMSRMRDWQSGINNRNRNIIERLERHAQPHRVLHVDVLPHTLQRGLRVLVEDIYRPPFRDRLRGGLFRLQEISENHFHLITVEPLISEYRFLQRLKQILLMLRFSNTILWSYLPTYVGAFRLPIFTGKVFDSVDNWSAHSRYSHWKTRLVKNYSLIAHSADVIFTVAESLRGLFPNHKNTHWVPNGVDLKRFQNFSPYRLRALPPAPRICYVGVIEQRVDIDLLSWVADQRPQYTFVFAGWVWSGVNLGKLKEKKNVLFLGQIPSDMIPGLLAQCQVGIVPHRSGALMDSMNPLKIYEYLAAGLPVVATGVRGFERYTAGVSVVQSKEAFLQSIDAAVQHPPTRGLLQGLLQHDSWDARVQTMWQKVNEVLQRKRRVHEEGKIQYTESAHGSKAS